MDSHSPVRLHSVNRRGPRGASPRRLRPLFFTCGGWEVSYRDLSGAASRVVRASAAAKFRIETPGPAQALHGSPGLSLSAPRDGRAARPSADGRFVYRDRPRPARKHRGPPRLCWGESGSSLVGLSGFWLCAPRDVARRPPRPCTDPVRPPICRRCAARAPSDGRAPRDRRGRAPGVPRRTGANRAVRGRGSEADQSFARIDCFCIASEELRSWHGFRRAGACG